MSAPFIIAIVVAVAAGLFFGLQRAPTPSPRTRETRSIELAPGTRFTLGTLAGGPYTISGWIEIETDASGFRLPALNFRATRTSERGARAEDCPLSLHIRATTDVATGTVNLTAGDVAVDFLIAVAYDELEALSDAPNGTRQPPRTVSGRMSLALSLNETGILGLRGSGTIDRLPPFSDGDVPFDFFSTPVAVTGAKCGEVTLCVDVANDGNTHAALLDATQLAAVITELNRIWGCPGQCCIHFSVSDTRHDGHETIMARDKNPDDDSAMRNAFRELKRHGPSRTGCYPVLFVGQIMTGTAGGGSFDDLGDTITNGDAHTRGSVVSTKNGTTALTPVAIGNILGHEMGHAMGVSNAPIKPEADGVASHSTHQDNLMRESGDATATDATLQANTKLNGKQCERARSSPLVQQTDNACGNAPLEAV